jgi:hypothetical protein
MLLLCVAALCVACEAPYAYALRPQASRTSNAGQVRQDFADARAFMQGQRERLLYIAYRQVITERIRTALNCVNRIEFFLSKTPEHPLHEELQTLSAVSHEIAGLTKRLNAIIQDAGTGEIDLHPSGGISLYYQGPIDIDHAFFLGEDSTHERFARAVRDLESAEETLQGLLTQFLTQIARFRDSTDDKKVQDSVASAERKLAETERELAYTPAQLYGHLIAQGIIPYAPLGRDDFAGRPLYALPSPEKLFQGDINAAARYRDADESNPIVAEVIAQDIPVYDEIITQILQGYQHHKIVFMCRGCEGLYWALKTVDAQLELGLDMAPLYLGMEALGLQEFGIAMSEGIPLVSTAFKVREVARTLEGYLVQEGLSASQLSAENKPILIIDTGERGTSAFSVLMALIMQLHPTDAEITRAWGGLGENALFSRTPQAQQFFDRAEIRLFYSTNPRLRSFLAVTDDNLRRMHAIEQRPHTLASVGGIAHVYGVHAPAAALEDPATGDAIRRSLIRNYSERAGLFAATAQEHSAHKNPTQDAA